MYLLPLVAHGDGARTLHRRRVSPFFFLLLFAPFGPRSSAWIMVLLKHAKESTSSGILSADIKHSARSDPSAAMSAAKSIPLSRRSRLRKRELKSRTLTYASTISGRQATRSCLNSTASVSVKDFSQMRLGHHKARFTYRSWDLAANYGVKA